MLNHLVRHMGRRGEGGQAMLFVLIAVVLLGTIPIAIATVTTNQLPQTTRNLNFEAAYEAAQGGLNDYLQHLDANESYGLYCKTCSNGTAGNPAFTSWVPLSTSPMASYSYAPTNKSGLIALQVSGKAGTGATSVVRTFNFSIRPASSLSDVYWTNYETLDPSLANTQCATHLDEPSANSYPNWKTLGIPQYGPPSGCEVTFQTGDVLNGPVFSDDTYRLCGTPTFTSSVESGNIYNTNAGSAGIYVGSSGCQSFTGPTATKVSNQTPRTASDDLTPARNYGCFITGGTAPSSLTPANVTLTLSVITSGSPPTPTTQITWSGSGAKVDNSASNTNACTSPITVSNLTTGLVFVNGSVTIKGQMTGGLDVVTCSSTTDASNGNCASSTPSNIVVSGNLTYPTANKVLVSGQPTSDSQDALGLIAANFVEVTTTTTIEIDAAILALADSFYVNNWTGSNYGTLNVFGSIAQNFRGPVGTTGGSGYLKNYNYDTSLQSLFPPFFIPPNGATWTPSTYEECASGLGHSVQSTPSC